MTNNNVTRFVEIAHKYLSNQKIQTILEIGARDCSETLDFYNLLHPKSIYTFECNPATLPLCRNKIKSFSSIHLIEKAVCNKNGKISFYQIDQNKTKTTWKDGNPGASSLLKASGKYPVEKYVQKKIKVNSIKLKTFLTQKHINHVDLLWMDIQGGELSALNGLGNKINTVSLIYTEVEFFEIYKNQPLFKDIKSYLEKNNFLFLGFTHLAQYDGDAIFINKSVLQSRKEKIKIRLWGDYDLLWNNLRPFQFLRIKRYATFIENIWHYCRKGYQKQVMWNKNFIKYHNTYNIDIMSNRLNNSKSKVKMDIIIPLAQKDTEILPFCIQSIHDYVRHPINKMFIVSTRTPELIRYCKSNNIILLDENSVLPIKRKSIHFICDGKDRSGWLFQQLIKLNGDSISTLDNYFFLDSDTVYIRPQVFEYNDKTIFDISDEYHFSYFKTYKKLFGNGVFLPASFTCHNMMINCLILKEMRNKIEERCHMNWYDAIYHNINKKEISPISEQETYGSYMFQHHRDQMILRYWYNLNVKRAEIKDINALKRLLHPFYKSISFHSYNVE